MFRHMEAGGRTRDCIGALAMHGSLRSSLSVMMPLDSPRTRPENKSDQKHIWKALENNLDYHGELQQDFGGYLMALGYISSVQVFSSPRWPGQRPHPPTCNHTPPPKPRYLFSLGDNKVDTLNLICGQGALASRGGLITTAPPPFPLPPLLPSSPSPPPFPYLLCVPHSHNPHSPPYSPYSVRDVV